MKKLVAIACAAVLTACTTAAPNQLQEPKEKTESGLKVTVTTSFLEDMVHVLAPEAAVTLIIPAGEDPHTYEAKPEDTGKLDNADLVLYHGLHFEGKMIDLLEAMNGKAVSAGFSDSDIGVMEEDGETILDPHFWFDIDLYKRAVQNAAGYLKEAMPDSASDIDMNCAAYLASLDELDEYNRNRLAEIPNGSRILVTPHDAFNYFSRRYGMEVKAPQGVSTDAELSNQEMAETADYIVANKIKAIFAESTTDPARMEKLKESCAEKGFEVEVVSGEGKELFSDSLAPKGQAGDTYLDMYKHNIDLIVDHLK